VAPEFIMPVSMFGIARHKARFAKHATPQNQQQRCILTDYFKNYNFSKLK
jgi:hypothetical protein